LHAVAAAGGPEMHERPPRRSPEPAAPEKTTIES
jgi:hypothetical protein